MDVELSAVVIYDSVLFGRGGRPSVVRAWAERLNRRFVTNAKQEAPKRTGELAASIHGDVDQVALRQFVTTIAAEADHSLYVLRGTTGPIMSRRMWGFRQRTGLKFPRGAYPGGQTWLKPSNTEWMRKQGYMLKVRAGNGFPQRYAVSVSGQEANNFFARAAAQTAVRHPSLRGFSPGFGY